MQSDNLLPWFLLAEKPEEIYLNETFLVLDFETDVEQNGSALHEPNDIVLACWQVVSPTGEVIKTAHTWGGIYQQAELLDDIKGVAFVVAQNAKFEAQWLKRCGAELRDILFYDTMLAEWVLHGNRQGKGFSKALGSMAHRYGVPGKKDIVASLIEMGVSTRDINPSWLLEYCHADVEATKNVFLKQRLRLSSRQQWHLVHTRNLTCAVLADVEFEGLNLDPTRVDEEYRKVAKDLQVLGSELAEMTGGINLGSPKQLAAYLYDVLKFKEPVDYKGEVVKTGKGARSTNSKVLADLVIETEEQKKFFDLYKRYNKAASLLEKNLDYFKLTCEQRGGRFFGQFKQGVVQTHRLASSGIPVVFEGRKQAKSVQLQNIPREYKRLFCAGEDDYEVAEFDGSQLEFRVAVDMGKDTVGLAEIENGVDIHSFTAKVLTDAGEPTTRQDAKAKTFRPLYGGGSGSKALQEYCEYFKDKYKGISGTQRNWALRCASKGEYTTPYGMVFYFPGTKMQRSGYITNSTNIYNYPVQGFATGEIIPLVLVYFWHRTRNMDVRIFATIHDSIACKIKKGTFDEVMEVAKQAFTYDVYNHLLIVYKYKFRVPLGLGAKVSSHWGDTKEETKIDCWPDGREEKR